MRRGFGVQLRRVPSTKNKNFYHRGHREHRGEKRRELAETISWHLRTAKIEFHVCGTGEITGLEVGVAKGRAKIIKSTVLYTGKVFRLLRDTVIEPGGVRANRDIIVHPGSVVVLPIFADGRVLLIRQYRHTVGGYLWELVAGRKEPDESPSVAA